MSLLFRALQKGDSRQCEGKQSVEQAKQVEHRRMDAIYRFNPPSQTGRWVMMGLFDGTPHGDVRLSTGREALSRFFPRPVLAA